MCKYGLGDLALAGVQMYMAHPENYEFELQRIKMHFLIFQIEAHAHSIYQLFLALMLLQHKQRKEQGKRNPICRAF